MADAIALDGLERRYGEREALSGVSLRVPEGATLTVYDMVKGLERGVEIAEVVLLEKTGGKEDWRRP